MMNKQEENKRAVIYARYSSAGQREASIEDQIRDCKAYAERKNYTIVAEYFDKAMTGTNDKRPDFQRMISDSANDVFDVVIVWKLDRFGRNRYDSATYRHKLKKNGVTIESAMESIPEGAEGIILESLLEGMSEYYSAALAENVKRGMRGCALKHQTLGYVVYGLRTAADGTYEIDPETAPIVREVYERYIAGESPISIRRDLTRRGIKNAHGRELTRDFIINMLKNEKYKGIYRWQDVIADCIPPIIPEDMWELAQKIRKRHRESPPLDKAEGGYLLTGFLKCGVCGMPMRAYAGTSRSGKVYKYYACASATQKNSGCPKYKKQFLEDSVCAFLNRIIFSDEIIGRYADCYLEWQEAQPKTSEKAADSLVELDRKISNVVDTIANGNALQSLVDRLRAMEAEREELIAEYNQLKLEESHHFSREDVVAWFEHFRQGDISDPSFMLATLNTFVDSITVMPTGSAFVQLNRMGEDNTITIEQMREIEGGAVILCSEEEADGRPSTTVRTPDGGAPLLWFKLQ